MKSRERLREEVVAFLNSVARPGCAVGGMDDDTNLIDAGVVDSLAVVQIILFLEQSYALHLQSSGIDPADLGSIKGILAAIIRTDE